MRVCVVVLILVYLSGCSVKSNGPLVVPDNAGGVYSGEGKTTSGEALSAPNPGDGHGNAEQSPHGENILVKITKGVAVGLLCVALFAAYVVCRIPAGAL